MDEDFRTLEFTPDGLRMIDQRLLPGVLEYCTAASSEDVASAIKEMIVRGAPAIGAAAGYGVYMALLEAGDDRELFLRKCGLIRNARPTAVNLMWAVDRMMRKAEGCGYSPELLKAEADAIVREDIEANHALSKAGLAVISKGDTILTHCNAGALAACGWGTALGVIKEAHRSGMEISVYADETRPRLQGARLTAWELMRAGIPAALIPDSAAAVLMRGGKIDLVIIGADRIAANGDTANKLGSFMLSVIAKEYGIPFYVAAPLSTIDSAAPDGQSIPIEERDADEVRCIEGISIAPAEMPVFNPAFDVTPHQNITGIITERGIIYPPFSRNIERIKSGEKL